MSLQAAEQTMPGLWPVVWKLLRLRWLITYNGFRRASLRRKIGMLFLVALILGFLGLIFFGSWFLLGFLRSPRLAEVAGNVQPLLDSVPVLAVSAAFLAILVTSFGVLLQALYLSGDMDFLLSAPVPIRAVFITKLLQAVLPNFGLICLFVLPLLFGLGAAEGYNFLYYPLVLIVLAALALAAAGLSSLMVMFVVRVFPARRVAEVLGFVGAIISFACSQSGQLFRFGQFSQGQADQAIQMATRFNTPWSPLSWSGRGLVALGERQWLPAGGFLILSLGVAFLIFGVALTTAERLYYTGWASIQNNRRRKKAPKVARPAVERPGGAFARRFIPPAVRAIAVKDYYVLRRDLRNLSQLVTPLIFGIIYAVLFLRGGGQPPLGRGEAPVWFNAIVTNLFVYINVGISLFVGWMLLSRLGGIGFSQEGKNYWMLKAAPVSVAQLVMAKFLVAFLPALVLGWAFLLVISLVQRAGLSLLLFTLPVVALCIAGNAGLNLSFGILGANMNWEDPRQMQRGAIGCLGALLSLIYMGVSLALFFIPTIILALFKLPVPVGQLTGLLVGGTFSLACAALPLWLVRKRVPLLGEST